MKQLCLTNVNEWWTTLTTLEVGKEYFVKPIDAYYCKVYKDLAWEYIGTYPLSLFTANV